MKYVSTRGKKEFSFKKILNEGMPSDGGLFVPKTIPKINFKNINNIKYYKLVNYILSKFMTKEEYKYFNIKKISKKIYNKTIFDFKKIKKRKIYFVDLNKGKTFSFKDISISFLSEILKKSKNINILTATSGDTGSSCIFYLRKIKKIKTFIFSPFNKISYFQESQMYSIKKKNIYNISLIGNFDNCQKIIKKNIILKKINTVNSVNFLRIILQSIYYIKCFLIFRKKIIFCIPTGNFGNSFSAYLAYKMGLPIKKIIVINNDNNTSYNLIKNNILFFKKKVIKTNSPSMDIIIPSNIERLIYYTTKKKKFFNIIKKIKKNKKITLKIKSKILDSGFCKKKKRNYIIKKFYKKNKKIIDPHFANLLVINFNKNNIYFLLKTALYVKFLNGLNKIIKKNIYSDFQKKMLNIKNKYYSFNNKDKNKIFNFLKKNKN
ncbi:hypothetical protein [Candidatus Vidania fulgoroideorum]